MKTKEYSIHPLALTYPPMSEPEMEALTADIAERGLQRPIVLYEGKILDGRNRYVACQKAGIEPTFSEYEGDDPLGQVNSLNLNRDLKAGQRAMVAAKQWMLSGDIKRGGRRVKGEQSTDCTLESRCQLLRASKSTIIQARDLLAEAPDLAEVVVAGSISLAEATEQLQGRQMQAQQTKKDAAKVAAYDAQFAEAIADGKMTPGEALLEITRREREEREKLRVETEARQIWFEQFRGVIEWAEKWVAEWSDEHLAQHIAGDAPDTGQHITHEDVDGVIVQLQRIKSLTTEGVSNGRPKGSQKARAGKV